MRRFIGPGLLAAMLLAGCGKAPEGGSEKLTAFDVREPAEPARPAAGPLIAYSYDLSYRLAPAAIASLQERQLAACRKLGPQRCLVLKSSLASDDLGSATGEASLVVDARLAPAFNRRLDAIAADAGGSVATRSMSAEDVTKQVIDTDASVRAKEALAARLLILIRSARANVGELVAAEKAYAETQEGLDAARSLQAALSRRVAMSQVDLHYSDTAATGTLAPVRSAVASAGSTLGESLRVLVTAIVALFPWVLLLLALRWITHRLGWRGPFRRLRDWLARRTPDRAIP